MKIKALIPLAVSILFHAVLFSAIAGMSGSGKPDEKGREITVELIQPEKNTDLPAVSRRAEHDMLAGSEQKEKISPEPDGLQKAGAEGINEQNALTYKSMILRRLQENRKYPAQARKRGIEGITTVNFTVLADGSAKGPEILKSSGQPVLDNEAVMMVKRSAPFPRPDGQVDMNVEVVFKLN